MLESDLIDAETQIDEALTSGARWPGSFALRTEAWFEHRGLVARVLRPDEWHALSSTFDYLHGINEFDRVYRGGGKGTKRIALDAQGRAQLELGHRLTLDGQEALRRLAKSHPSRLSRIAFWRRRVSSAAVEQMIEEGMRRFGPGTTQIN